MSSVKMRENRIRRKPKDSYATSIGVGLVGPKPQPKGAGDGQPVNIPAPPTSRFKAKGGHGKLGEACLLDMVRLTLWAMPEQANPFRRYELRGKGTRGLALENFAEAIPSRKASWLWDVGDRTANRHR